MPFGFYHSAAILENHSTWLGSIVVLSASLILALLVLPIKSDGDGWKSRVKMRDVPRHSASPKKTASLMSPNRTFMPYSAEGWNNRQSQTLERVE